MEKSEMSDEGWNQESTGGGTNDNVEHEEYGFMERELAFKLLASHAMVDAEFYRLLREDPRAAAEQLHIALSEEDVNYIQSTVDWNSLDEHADAVRSSLVLEAVTRSW